MAAAASFDEESIDDNPLLQDFEFPPFDVLQPKHIRPGIRELLKKLVGFFYLCFGFWLLCLTTTKKNGFCCLSKLFQNLTRLVYFVIFFLKSYFLVFVTNLT